jgi:hypothetical protein
VPAGVVQLEKAGDLRDDASVQSGEAGWIAPAEALPTALAGFQSTKSRVDLWRRGQEPSTSLFPEALAPGLEGIYEERVGVLGVEPFEGDIEIAEGAGGIGDLA